MAKQHNIIIKLLGIGDSGVGKTCLICRFADDDFTSPRHSTVGIDFKLKSMEVGGKKVKIQLWDTAGQERFDTLIKHYYRRAQGIFIVYDITREQSFLNIEKWLKDIKDFGPENPDLMLLGNKCDMEAQRVVSLTKGQKLAKQLNIQFYETSAKDSTNIEEAFLWFAGVIIKKHKREFNSIQLESEENEGEFISELLQEKRSKCCN